MPGDTSERQGTETKASGKLEGFLGGRHRHHEDKLTRDSGPETFACAGSCQRCRIWANINPALG